MKQLIRLTIVFCAFAALALMVVAGPEPLPSGKEMKQVAPAPPPECNWTGFYVGLHVGGQWGHSEITDEDGYQAPPPNEWGFDESGVVAGGQIGYNFQWNWLVLGIEGSLGYMDLDGSGSSKFNDRFFAGDTRGHTESDFYTTILGRLGFAWGHWLFYGAGGGIGVNYETRVNDDCAFSGACGDELIHAGQTDFNWGWAAGGGIQYMFGCHWMIGVEYLRYQLDDQDFNGEATFLGAPAGDFHFKAQTEGNIVRGALNYKF